MAAEYLVAIPFCAKFAAAKDQHLSAIPVVGTNTFLILNSILVEYRHEPWWPVPWHKTVLAYVTFDGLKQELAASY